MSDDLRTDMALRGLELEVVPPIWYFMLEGIPMVFSVPLDGEFIPPVLRNFETKCDSWWRSVHGDEAVCSFFYFDETDRD